MIRTDRLKPALRAVALLGVWCLAVQPAARSAEAIRTLPDRVELQGPRARHGLLVSVEGPAGPRDVTGRAVLVSSNPGVVAITPAGECEARGDGAAEIKVTFEGVTATVPVVARGTGERAPPSFLSELEPLLTRFGCNQGACHGKLAGQNGFRLSLRGYAPDWDFDWITREAAGRRVDRAFPGMSLLARKPLGLVPHEGGRLFAEGSRAHALLVDWVRGGMPGPDGAEPAIEALEVSPGARVLRPGQTQRLLARARAAGVPWVDVTWLTKFESNDAGMAEVDASGLVRVLRPGETAVRASFRGLVRVVIVTSPYDRPVDPARFVARQNVIDDHVFPKLEALRIEPSGPSPDAEYLRRAFLDAIGTLPTPDEVRAFLADPGLDKRARLVEALLARPEYVDYWALQLGDLFQNRKERDHDVRGAKGVRAFHTWLRAQVAANRPWDALVRDVLTATGSAEQVPSVGYYLVNVGEARPADQSEVVASVAQTFLGTRIGCAKCHNHPLERYTQDDYYAFGAFFSRVKFDRNEPGTGKGPTRLFVSTQDPQANGEPVGAFQPRTGRFLPPRTLDGAEVTVGPGDDPRLALAAWVTGPTNGAFAGSMVNRLWKHYFGLGLVEPVDDLRASNPPSNPALWETLRREFVGHGYDLKHVTRLILNSRAYGLASATVPGNAADTRFGSHYAARRLPAEVLLDAVSQATGVPEAFPGYPVGLRAAQLPDPATQSYFLSLFGRSDRVTACACERSGEVTLPQLLHTQNGDSFVRKAGDPESRLALLLRSGATDDRVIEELFLATLTRFPEAPERAAVRAALADGGSREEAFRDLFWALLNAQEFTFNH